MLRMFATRILCLCLAALVAVQLSAPMASASTPPCHRTDIAACSGDAPARCPLPDPSCGGEGCLVHGVAVPASPQRVLPAPDIPGRTATADTPPLHPLLAVWDVLRPPRA